MPTINKASAKKKGLKNINNYYTMAMDKSPIPIGSLMLSLKVTFKPLGIDTF